MLQLNHRVLQLGEEASSQQAHIENNGITIQLLTQRLEEAGRREEVQVSTGQVSGVERGGHIGEAAQHISGAALTCQEGGTAPQVRVRHLAGKPWELCGLQQLLQVPRQQKGVTFWW